MGSRGLLRGVAAGLTVALVGMAGPAPAGTGLRPLSNQPVKLPIMQSSDFDFIVTVYGEVLKEAGYRVEYVNADYSATFTGVKAGDLDVTMGWDSTPDLISDVIDSGKGINAGSSGVAIEEGWWYPAYVEEVCPGLPDWEALKNPDCMEALSTAETAPMGRYVGVPAGWSSFTEERIEAFGLDMENVSSGSPITMAATIQGAIQRGEPVMGWGYNPHWLMATNEGGFVEFPDYAPECYEDPAWGINPDKTYDCGFASGYVWKLANLEFTRREPFATRILFLMNLDENVVGIGMNRVDNEGVTLIEAAREWMDANEERWTLWIE